MFEVKNIWSLKQDYFEVLSRTHDSLSNFLLSILVISLWIFVQYL